MDASSPMVDARLSDGSRVQRRLNFTAGGGRPRVVDSPLRHRETDARGLVAKRAITEGMMELLKATVQCR